MNHVTAACLLAATISLLAPADAPKPTIIILPDGKSVIPAPSPSPAPIPTSANVSGERFELLTLQGGTGPITWDITSPTAFVPPVVIFERKSGSTATGWRMGATAPAEYQIGDTPTIEVYAVGDGAATVSAWGVQNSRPVKLATFTIVANKGPRPPPSPEPEPKPPEPSPSPIPEAGFRVLIVYETNDLSRYPPAQLNVIYAKSVRDYLNQKTVMGPDGRTHEWRIYDKDVDMAGESKIWQEVMKRPRSSTPWIVIATGTSGYEGPLPANSEATLALLRKYGGN